jgi:hypothetical protein
MGQDDTISPRVYPDVQAQRRCTSTDLLLQQDISDRLLGGAGGCGGNPHPRPLSRTVGTLTPGPSPALRAPSPPAPLPHCGRGVIWFVRSPLLRSSPPSSPATWERKGVGGRVRGIIPPPLPQRGRGVIWFVRSPLLRSSPPSSPTAWERGDLVREIAPALLIPSFLSHSVGEG